MLVLAVLSIVATAFGSPTILSPSLQEVNSRHHTVNKVELQASFPQQQVTGRHAVHHTVHHAVDDHHTPVYHKPAVHQPTFARHGSVAVHDVHHQAHVSEHHHENVAARHHDEPAYDGTSASARIVQQDMEVNPDGTFINVWNSENGIQVQEQGTIKRVSDVDVPVQQGEISYVDHEGNQFHLKYVADETGFHPQGDHLPTPPPLPAGIARGLEFIAAHPSAESTTYSPFQHAPVVIDN